MQPYENLDIQEIPLSSPFFRNKAVDFLAANGLRLESVDVYYTVQDSRGEILAGAGLYKDIIKCVAVSSEARSGGLVAPLVSQLAAEAASKGYLQLKLFTKPENRSVFESLGFHEIASAPKAVLMENGRGLEQYVRRLKEAASGPGRAGVVVMNANPLTLGHQYLVREALRHADRLFVIPVREDLSRFPAEERLAMMQASLQGACVLEGSPYQISVATFPTYFLKNLSDASETQMRLDIDLFARHIAPALGVAVRFVGSEPSDNLTARYNALMQELLPSRGIEVVEIPRLSDGGEPVSASLVRAALDDGRFAAAAALTPSPVHPFLLADLCDRALRLELDTPLKPGLVGPDGSGSHADMDYALMQKSVSALRPFWSRMACAATAEELRQGGLAAEKAMLEATGGVNTHRGAIFAVGLALNAFARHAEVIKNEADMQKCLVDLAETLLRNQQILSPLENTPESHGSAAVAAYGVKGARQMARDGYQLLFTDWLPYYRSMRFPVKPGMTSPDRFDRPSLQKTLLRIMSTLDDTCVIHRVGYERAQQVRREAGELLERFSEEKLEAMCRQYAAEGISPGGAADMLALTIFMDSIINK